MRFYNEILKYIGAKSDIDDVCDAFESDINECIREEFKQILNAEPTPRDSEIKEIIRKEKVQYEIKKKEFYDDPLHWTNNKRRRHGLNTLRGKTNKYRSKKYPSFKPTPTVFFLLEDIIEESLCETLLKDNFFEKFVDFNNIDIGDRNTFFIKEK